MAAMEAANHHRNHGSQQPYPSLPASPTLTNPDMILPEHDYRSDSPDPQLDGRDHPLMMWTNGNGNGNGHLDATTAGAMQRAGHAYGSNGAVTPTTPIIYGNGTMLSDIGEVTEVESTPGKPSPSRTRAGTLRRLESPTRGSGSDVALRSSPTMGAAAAALIIKKSKQSLIAMRERRSSIDSNSTITTQEQPAVFADFDDTVSVGDSVFQGDDEESMASSYVEGTPAPAPGPARLGVPSVENLDRLSTYSTTSLSRKAEEILANAKQRLTTMEDNLTRARSSLHVTSPPYGSDGSTPSPPLQRASTTTFSRGGGRPAPASTSPGHARISSDIAMRNGLPYRVSVQRSQSAMGAAGGYRQPLVLSKSAGDIRGTADEKHARSTYKISTARETGLQPLNEDDAAQLEELESQGAKLDQLLSPTFGAPQDEGTHGSGRGLQRSASAAQMRDIKDQMKDLKGKISSLREQARADGAKRRSLQSLRTPSPFTHSQIDQWYAEPKSDESSEAGTSNQQSKSRNPWNGEESSVNGDGKDKSNEPYDNDGLEEEDEDSIFDDADNRTHLRPAGDRSLQRMSVPLPILTRHAAEVDMEDDDHSDMLTQNGDDDDDDDDDGEADFQDAVDLDYASESGDSMYHDTVQHPLSHEDREDAFDYEHFFLHSAMGTMSQQRIDRRGSTDSFTSEGSMETTRGLAVDSQLDGSNDDDDSNSFHSSPVSRSHSVASISTIETFATAEEGRARRSTESSRKLDMATEGAYGGYFGQLNASPDKIRPESTGRPLRSAFGGAPIKTHGTAHPSVSSIVSSSAVSYSDGSTSSIPEEVSDPHNSEPGQRVSAARRPMSASTSASNSLHRPSVSSFDSTGTHRSFPLINKTTMATAANTHKKATSTGVLTPNSSPDHELRRISHTLMEETASICEQQQKESGSDSYGQQDEQQAQPQRRRESTGTSEMGPSKRMPNSNVYNNGLGSNPNAPLALQTLAREDKFLVERLVADLGKCVLGLTENGRASAESRMYRRRIDKARRMLEGIDGE
ncbi:hypothetical protein B0T22DRAFT_373875 [Podospora appendiculata]|uniref:Uncharacterized protein n=1 Tax=Podospora appendiculata TaxID=314037 RepID=A0AAE0XIB3_9PEZI|nr:hypothetical protein B0T22DRAFT_373875 [Podospora appendiculata]